MPKSIALSKLRDIVFTSITGSVSGGTLAMLNDIDYQQGAQLGLFTTMSVWTYITLIEHKPKVRYRSTAVITGAPKTSYLVNGKQTFMKTIGWYDKREKKSPPLQETYLVNHRDQVHPIVIGERVISSYVLAGWKRQIAGKRYPFSRKHYKGNRRKVECCYRLLGEAGCFDTYGQGRESRLIPGLTPARISTHLKFNYSYSG